MSIQPEMALVYSGGGRRFFTLKAACRAEAKMIIGQHIRAGGEDPSEMDTAEYMAWVAHLAAKIKRGNRQFDIENPLDKPLGGEA